MQGCIAFYIDGQRYSHRAYTWQKLSAEGMVGVVVFSALEAHSSET
jgi:hypothetical protein